MTEQITTCENLSDNVVEFETREEFTEYYEKNKEEIDKMATRGLNIKYKITGYKIGRKKNIITFIPVKQEVERETNDLQEEKLDVLITKVNRIEKNLKLLFDKMNEIIQLSESNRDNRQQSSYTSASFDTYGRIPRNPYQ